MIPVFYYLEKLKPRSTMINRIKPMFSERK